MEVADQHPPTARFRAMGSDATVVVAGDPALASVGRERVDELETLWSRFIEGSDIDRLNSTNGWVTVSAETLTLVEHSVQAARETGGAFNPTVLPSLVAHGYDRSRTDRDGVTRLRFRPVVGPAADPAGIEIDRNRGRIRLPADVAFDAGGIGKGLAADMVAEQLVAAGADAALVGIGGDLRIAGHAPDAWSVAIEHPRHPDVSIANVALECGAVCTSSTLSNMWRHNGRDVHHLIDPTTGSPIDGMLASVSVIAAEGWRAEALCKIAIPLDPISALTAIEDGGASGVVVGLDDIVWQTPSFSRFAA